MTITLLKERETKPRKSYKFGDLSVFYNGVHYFPNDIKPSTVRDGKPFEIQGVFHDGKWRQDTFYITQELRDLLIRVV